MELSREEWELLGLPHVYLLQSGYSEIGVVKKGHHRAVSDLAQMLTLLKENDKRKPYIFYSYAHIIYNAPREVDIASTLRKNVVTATNMRRHGIVKVPGLIVSGPMSVLYYPRSRSLEVDRGGGDLELQFDGMHTDIRNFPQLEEAIGEPFTFVDADAERWPTFGATSPTLEGRFKIVINEKPYARR